MLLAEFTLYLIDHDDLKNVSKNSLPLSNVISLDVKLLCRKNFLVFHKFIMSLNLKSINS